MRKGEKIETEGFHNQTLTESARRLKADAGSVKKTRKVVALQLDEVEQAAFRYLGGVDGLKALICPPGLCIRCRKASRRPGSWLDCLCKSCNDDHGET
ncbi:MAG: hypothetical protein QNK37_30365 [Acidobacteriota bacterium]|nr:hypothetical protein [Acidobacteriota bacterium]